MIFYKLHDLNKYNEWTYFHLPHITFIYLLNTFSASYLNTQG
jgi:hypothetical protein